MCSIVVYVIHVRMCTFVCMCMWVCGKCVVTCCMWYMYVRVHLCACVCVCVCGKCVVTWCMWYKYVRVRICVHACTALEVNDAETRTPECGKCVVMRCITTHLHQGHLKFKVSIHFFLSQYPKKNIQRMVRAWILSQVSRSCSPRCRSATSERPLKSYLPIMVEANSAWWRWRSTYRYRHQCGQHILKSILHSAFKVGLV